MASPRGPIALFDQMCAGMIQIRESEGRFLSLSAIVQGDVTLGEGCNVWHHSVIRGDVAPIVLGRQVNVQDGCIIHCKHDVPCNIGDRVALGHRAVFHGTSIGPGSLIGIGALVLDDCTIGEECLIGAGTVLAPGTRVPDGKVVLGVPGKLIRDIRPEERRMQADIINRYMVLARRHAAGEFPLYGRAGM